MKKCVFSILVCVFLASLIWVVSLQGLNLAGEDEDIRFNKDDSMRTLETKLQAMREEIKINGDTFEVGMNSAMQYPLEELCAFNLDVKPDNSYLNGEKEQEMALVSDIPCLPLTYMGYYSPVKNQGPCGGAWAFVTTGVLEGIILKKDDMVVNISEQYLIDCNIYGYTCAYGWFCHGMHMDPYGAYLESHYPFPTPGCVPPYRPDYRISSWRYVGDSSSVPTVLAIKQKIYDYGSVACLVYADAYFQAYASGCFSRNASGTPNHFVILVGWDDTNCSGAGAWRLKNSWGTGWGENGFMWIKYGVQKVGYAANYVVYP